MNASKTIPSLCASLLVSFSLAETAHAANYPLGWTHPISLITLDSIPQTFVNKRLIKPWDTPVVCVRHSPFLPATNYPVRWRESLRLPSLDPRDIKARLMQRVDLGGNPPEYVLAMKRYSPIDGDTVEERVVRTGMEYLQALVDGYYAATWATYDISLDGYFVRDTLTVVAIAMASPSALSWVSDFQIQDIQPSTLEFDAITAERPHYRDASCRDFYPDMIFDYDTNTHSFSIRNKEQSHDSFTHIGWGDVNNDGIEDLIFVRDYVSGIGTLTWHTLYALTRIGKDSLFRTVDFGQGCQLRWFIESVLPEWFEAIKSAPDD